MKYMFVFGIIIGIFFGYLLFSEYIRKSMTNFFPREEVQDVKECSYPNFRTQAVSIYSFDRIYPKDALYAGTPECDEWIEEKTQEKEVLQGILLSEEKRVQCSWGKGVCTTKDFREFIFDWDEEKMKETEESKRCSGYYLSPKSQIPVSCMLFYHIFDN